MTSILLNISRIKDNEIWSVNRKSQEKYFYKKMYTENGAGKLVPDRFFFFLTSFMLAKSKWSAWFHYISVALKLAYNRSKLFKTLHY